MNCPLHPGEQWPPFFRATVGRQVAVKVPHPEAECDKPENTMVGSARRAL